MPYIKQEARVDIDHALATVIGVVSTYGEANYAITRLLMETFNPTSYGEYNGLIGVLECCKLELYRRAVAPYEDLKAKENGEVYV